MKEAEVVVIGGGPAGYAAATEQGEGMGNYPLSAKRVGWNVSNWGWGFYQRFFLNLRKY